MFVKPGREGAYWSDGLKRIAMRAVAVDDVVDTTGAGDAFTAAFAVALAEGRDEREAVRWGCAAGAHMVEHPGVVPGLPTREELIATGRSNDEIAPPSG